MARKHKSWLRAYVNYTQFNETPEAIHFCVGASMIAGVLRRKVWIDERYFKWFPNFYTVIVAPPGVIAKTTSLDIGLDLLSDVPGVRLGPDSATWQAIGRSLSEAKELIPIPNLHEPHDPEGVNGTMVTDLLNGQFMPMSALTVGLGELGTLINLHDKDMVDNLTAWWDGRKRPWRRETSTQGKYDIENPFLNIVGCTTPAWIGENFPSYMIGGGLASRMLFVYASKKRQLVAYPSDILDEGRFDDMRQDLIADLKIISEFYGPYILSKEARQWGREWYARHWDTSPEKFGSPRYGGYIARKQTHIHKMAMVIAASKRDKLVIETEDIQAAEAIVTGLEADMINVFQHIGQSDSAKQLNEVMDVLRYKKKVARTQLWQAVMHSMDFAEFTNTLQSGKEAKMLSWKVEGNEVWIYDTRS